MRAESGFTLLEMLIAFAILSFALVSVLSSFSQSARVQARADKLAVQASDLAVLQPLLQELAQQAAQEGGTEIKVEDRIYLVRARPRQEHLYEISIARADDLDGHAMLQTWVWAKDDE